MNAEPMKDELKKGGSQKREEEAGGKEQVRFGTKAGMFRKTKEMPVYDHSIKALVYQDKRGGGPVRNWDSRFETSEPTAPGRRGDFRWGRTTHPNKPNRFKFWWVNEIAGFRPRQSQDIYLPCCQLDTTKFGPVF